MAGKSLRSLAFSRSMGLSVLWNWMLYTAFFSFSPCKFPKASFGLVWVIDLTLLFSLAFLWCDYIILFSFIVRQIFPVSHKLWMGDFMNNVNTKVFERELLYDNVVVLKYHIEYPCIFDSSGNLSIMRFNDYNCALALEVKNRAETELYQEAIQTYLYNKENGYPSWKGCRPKSCHSNYNISIQTKRFICPRRP